jgi:hypothetical protein
MATLIWLFSSIGDYIPIFREKKLTEANPEGFVNRLHYRGTCMFLLVSCLMVTCTEWVSGTGSVIECMHGEGLPDAVARMYCYVQVRSLLYPKPDSLVIDELISHFIFRVHSVCLRIKLITTPSWATMCHRQVSVRITQRRTMWCTRYQWVTVGALHVVSAGDYVLHPSCALSGGRRKIG